MQIPVPYDTSMKTLAVIMHSFNRRPSPGGLSGCKGMTRPCSTFSHMRRLLQRPHAQKDMLAKCNLVLRPHNHKQASHMDLQIIDSRIRAITRCCLTLTLVYVEGDGAAVLHHKGQLFLIPCWNATTTISFSRSYEIRVRLPVSNATSLHIKPLS
jgi:hypothetical protein